jgi:hypothetical protein
MTPPLLDELIVRHGEIDVNDFTGLTIFMG